MEMRSQLFNNSDFKRSTPKEELITSMPEGNGIVIIKLSYNFYRNCN